MKEEWLFQGAIVPIDAATTTALVAEIKRLIDVVGGMALAQPEQQAKPPVNQFNQGIEACMSRLYEMHRITTGRHNFYVHAALELAKLKELT